MLDKKRRQGQTREQKRTPKHSNLEYSNVLRNDATSLSKLTDVRTLDALIIDTEAADSWTWRLETPTRN